MFRSAFKPRFFVIIKRILLESRSVLDAYMMDASQAERIQSDIMNICLQTLLQKVPSFSTSIFIDSQRTSEGISALYSLDVFQHSFESAGENRRSIL